MGLVINTDGNIMFLTWKIPALWKQFTYVFNVVVTCLLEYIISASEDVKVEIFPHEIDRKYDVVTYLF